jgi:hypothetical protein
MRWRAASRRCFVSRLAATTPPAFRRLPLRESAPLESSNSGFGTEAFLLCFFAIFVSHFVDSNLENSNIRSEARQYCFCEPFTTPILRSIPSEIASEQRATP